MRVQKHSFEYQKYFPCMCRQDVRGEHPAPLADALFNVVTGRQPCGIFTEMIKTCKKCWKVKDPGALCFEDVWVGGLRAPWLNISHEPECNPDHSSAALWWDGGGRGEAGEILPNTRGSDLLGEMEGLRERRGEHSKALWRLAAVGRAAVFPKKPPPTGKQSLFFPLHKNNLYPTAESEDQLWTLRGKKNPQMSLLSARYTHGAVHVALKHSRCCWTDTAGSQCPRHISKTCQRWWLIKPVSLLRLSRFPPNLHLHSASLKVGMQRVTSSSKVGGLFV